MVEYLLFLAESYEMLMYLILPCTLGTILIAKNYYFKEVR